MGTRRCNLRDRHHDQEAGSKEAFRLVDHDLPLSFARVAHQAGTQNFALVSAIGASVDSSFFYARVKGELERDVRELDTQTASSDRRF
jgi:uncharacterized protein YbjT (DUF2867 family)